MTLSSHDFYKFELDTKRSFELDFYSNYDKRLPKLKDLSASMIYSNDEDISNMLRAVVHERLENKCVTKTAKA